MTQSDQSTIRPLVVPWTEEEQALVRAMLIYCERQLQPFGLWGKNPDATGQGMTLRVAIQKAWPGVIW